MKIMAANTKMRRNSKTKRGKKGKHVNLEHRFITYMHQCIHCINKQTLFLEKIVLVKTSDVLDKLLTTTNGQLQSKELMKSRSFSLQKRKKYLAAFNASYHWLSLFSKQNNLFNRRRRGSEVFLNVGDVAAARPQLQKLICKVLIEK